MGANDGLVSPRAGYRAAGNGGLGRNRDAMPPAKPWLPASPQPTISLPEKNCPISCAAVAAASEPWTEFSPIDLAWTLRMVPGAALAGSVAPIRSRYRGVAISPFGS